MPIHIEQISHLLHETARDKMLPHYGRLGDEHVSSKIGDVDNIVTVADLDVQNAILPALGRLHPGSCMIAEESVPSACMTRYRNTVDPADISALKSADSVFVLDPLDGTYPFRNHRPGFGTILAHVSRGECTHGWILDALGGTILTAEKGSGVFLTDMETGASRRMKLDGGRKPRLGHTYIPPEHVTDAHRESLRENGIGFAKGYSSSVSIFHALLKNEIDFRVTHVYEFPWDILAGSMMMGEAGGKSALLHKNRPYDPFEMDSSMLWASSEENWDRLNTIFTPIITHRYFGGDPPAPTDIPAWKNDYGPNWFSK